MAKAPTPDNAGVVIDNGVKLPEQLRKQMAEAQTIRDDMNKPAGEPADPAKEPDAPAPDQGNEPAAPPAAAAPAAPPASEGDQTWEQRHRSLEGRFQKERENNRALVDRLNQMEDLIARMQAAGAQPADPNATPPAPKKLVSDEEEQEYGAELLGVVGKRAREEISPELEQLASRLKGLETRVDGVTTVTTKTAVEGLYGKLDAAVPNWRQVNRSDEFKDWLSKNDLYSGKPRIGMLQEAFSRQEADRVINFFKGFTTEAASPPQNPQAQDPSAPPASGSGKPSLETFAAPGRARSAPAAPTAAVDKPVYTHAQIAEFMAAKRTGKWKGREADAEAIERDIFQAQHEGRIHAT